MNRILVIEDEEVILKALKKLLERNHYDVTTAQTVEEAIDAHPKSFDLILADLRLPGAEGTDIIPLADPIPVVIMTSHASVRSAVNAMRYGAIDYIAKPFDHDELLLIIERSLLQNRMRAQNQSLKQDVKRLVPTDNVSSSQGLSRVLEELRSLEQTNRFVALHGECGTGKELLARVAHTHSARCDAPFVVADIPAIQTDRVHITLLGGDAPKPEEHFMAGGLLHAANNGTLVIRHPSAIPASVQCSLAEALNERKGASSMSGRVVNVQTILISEKSLQAQVDNEQLQPELANLFSDVEFKAPALRELAKDVVTLAEHYLNYFSRHHHREALKFSADAKAAMTAYHWPGNADELKSLVERAVLLSSDHNISASDLGLSTTAGETYQHDLSLDDYFRYFVTRHQETLSETELASRLGISRKALWERRQKMQLLR